MSTNTFMFYFYFQRQRVMIRWYTSFNGTNIFLGLLSGTRNGIKAYINGDLISKLIFVNTLFSNIEGDGHTFLGSQFVKPVLCQTTGGSLRNRIFSTVGFVTFIHLSSTVEYH